MPRKDGVARQLLRPDLKAVPLSYIDNAGRYADFHSLRHSFITHLGRSGAHSKTVQDLARHSTPALMARYTHGFKEDEVTAVNQLPDFSPTCAEGVRKTGTNDSIAGDDPHQYPHLKPHQRQRETVQVNAARCEEEGQHKAAAGDSGDCRNLLFDAALCTNMQDGAKENGEGGIRTLGASNNPHDGLANRCLKPLGHLSRCQ